MSEKVDANLAHLLESSVAIETSPGGRTLWITKLGLETAIKIGHALTVELDAPQGVRGMYKPERYTYERALSEAQAQLASAESMVFGETRPADRNLAVRVETAGESFSLTADVRNAYEDNPELEGGRILQRGFIAALGKLDLSGLADSSPSMV